MLNKDEIKDASLDDIVFDGRNKQYGAYELRARYGKRLLTALMVAIFAVVSAFLVSFVVVKNAKKNTIKITTTVIDNLNTKKKEMPKIAPPPPPPPPPKPIPKEKMAKFTTPKIVHNAETMKKMDEIDKSIVDKTNQGGSDATNQKPPEFIPPTPDPEPEPEKPKPAEIPRKVDVAAKFKGDWNQFLFDILTDMVDPDDVEKKESINVEFIVDVDGTVSNVRALNGSQVLRDYAVSAIKKSGKWTPAENGGVPTKAYKIQKIVFEPGE